MDKLSDSSSSTSSVFSANAISHGGSSVSSYYHEDEEKKAWHMTVYDDGMRCLLVPKNVIICYGPYMVRGVMDFRTERLHGLLKTFHNNHVLTKLSRAHHINVVKVWYLGSNIFTCKMTDLYYGGDGSADPRCKTAYKIFAQIHRKAHTETKMRYNLQRAKEKQKCPNCKNIVNEESKGDYDEL